jgi:hypothetical protein
MVVFGVAKQVLVLFVAHFHHFNMVLIPKWERFQFLHIGAQEGEGGGEEGTCLD